jgi:hypothetical protein
MERKEKEGRKRFLKKMEGIWCWQAWGENKRCKKIK